MATANRPGVWKKPFSCICSPEERGDLARSLYVYTAVTVVSKFRGKYEVHVLVRGMNPIMQLFWLEVRPMADQDFLLCMLFGEVGGEGGRFSLITSRLHGCNRSE